VLLRILIHGGLVSGSQWEPIVPELADRFRVITPDIRGHGRSTNPTGELSYTRVADDVAALISALGLQRLVVGGWSDGGQVTLELGARHPEAAAALIVGAAYPDFHAGGLREAHRALLGADETGVPDPAHVDAELGEFAEEIKTMHPGGDERGGHCSARPRDVARLPGHSALRAAGNPDAAPGPRR
jgi:pimeloyl-ACP methyl ester carboxylesterase